jgi:hypothetical protein
VITAADVAVFDAVAGTDAGGDGHVAHPTPITATATATAIPRQPLLDEAGPGLKAAPGGRMAAFFPIAASNSGENVRDRFGLVHVQAGVGAKKRV